MDIKEKVIMNMNRKSKKLLILILVLAVLVTAYEIIIYSAARNAEIAAKESEAQSIENTINVITLGDAAKITYNNGSIDMSFSNDGEKWNYDYDSEFPVNQTRLDNFENGIIGLTATRKISEMDTMEAYGLDTPLYSLEITDTTGNVQTLMIGNQTGGEYYAMVLGRNEVYTISNFIVSFLEYDLMDFVAEITVPSISTDNVSYIKVYNGSTLELKKNDNTWSYNVDGEAGTVTNTAAITDVVETVKGFTGGDCQDYNCEDDEKAQYGLDIPYYEVTINYTDENGKTCVFKLYVGNSLESGDYYYYSNSESGMVGLVAASYVTALADSFNLSYESE